MTINNTIYLNGVLTTGACPVCGDLECQTSHGNNSRGGRMHWQSCPTCGDHMVQVLWDCPQCPVCGELSDGKPTGRFRCVVCGDECNGSDLVRDPMSTGAAVWTCRNFLCGGRVERISDV